VRPRSSDHVAVLRRRAKRDVVDRVPCQWARTHRVGNDPRLPASASTCRTAACRHRTDELPDRATRGAAHNREPTRRPPKPSRRSPVTRRRTFSARNRRRSVKRSDPYVRGLPDVRSAPRWPGRHQRDLRAPVSAVPQCGCKKLCVIGGGDVSAVPYEDPQKGFHHEHS
jgi:hypothetical protein